MSRQPRKEEPVNPAPRAKHDHVHGVETRYDDTVGTIRNCECGQPMMLDHVDLDRPGTRAWKTLPR